MTDDDRPAASFVMETDTRYVEVEVKGNPDEDAETVREEAQKLLEPELDEEPDEPTREVH